MEFKGLKPIVYGGREVWPLVEGGKGVAVSNHASSGAWAAAGGIGTVRAVNADSYDSNGLPIPQGYPQKTRQIVVTGKIHGNAHKIKWALKKEGASQT